MTDIVKRTTLMVRDADAAARFLETVFGMTRAMDTPFTLSGEQLAAGAKGDRLRLVLMKAEHDQIGMIGLMEWVEPRMAAPAGRPIRIPFGMPVFVVAAEDCRATVERARAAGAHIHCEAREWQVTGFGGVRQEMIGASFFDPDGYFFEVNQRVS